MAYGKPSFLDYKTFEDEIAADCTLVLDGKAGVREIVAKTTVKDRDNGELESFR
jgi:hypothetical protein